MTDKMREEFEAVYAEEFSVVRGYKPSPEEMVSMRDGDGYGAERGYLNGYWKGWKRSRELLVIELPVATVSMFATSRDARAAQEGLDMARGAIIDAGLKVKP